MWAALLYFRIFSIFYSIILSIINQLPFKKVTKSYQPLKNCIITMDSQKHILRVIVQIKEVHLSLKFPCSLVFLLRSGHESIDSQNMHQLEKGICQPKEILKIDICARYFDQTYPDAYVNLCLMLVSTRGEISAGTVPILVNGYELGKTSERNQSISQCPDPQGSLTFTVTTQFIGVTENQQLILDIEESPFDVEDNEVERIPFQDIKTSRVNYSKHYSPWIKSQFSQSQAHQRHTLLRDKPNFMSPQNYLKMSYRQNQQKVNFISPAQKHEYMADGIDNIKERIRSSRISHQREEVGRIYETLKSQKQKNLALQKRERQLQSEKKRLEQELSQKESNLDIFETSILIEEKKNREIQKLENQLRKKNEEVSEMKIKALSIQKRNEELKESLDEQYNNIFKKYKKSQKERQQIMMGLNKKICQLQETEKKYQKVIKDKQIKFHEQRAKFDKEKRIYEMQISLLKQKEGQQLIDDKSLLEKNHQLNIHIKQREKRIQQLKYQNQKMTIKIQHQEKIRTKLQKQKQQLQKNVEQKIVEIKSLKKQVSNSGITLLEQRSKITELSQTIKTLTNQKEDIQNEVKFLKRQMTVKQNNQQNGQQNKKLQTELDHSQEKTKEYQSQCKQLSLNMLDMKNQVQKQNEKIREISKEKAEFQQKLLAEHSKVEKLEKQMQSIKEREESSNSVSNQKNHQENNESSIPIESYDQQKLSDFRQIKDKEVDQLKLKLTEFKESNNKLNNDIKLFYQQIASLKECNNTLTLNNKSLRKVIEDLNETIILLKKNVANPSKVDQETFSNITKKQLQDLLLQLSEKKKEVMSLEIQCERYESKILQMKNSEEKNKVDKSQKQHKRVRSQPFLNEIEKKTLIQKSQEFSYLQTKVRQLQMIIEEKDYDLDHEKSKIKKFIEQIRWLLEENKRIQDEVVYLREQFIKNINGNPQYNPEKIYFAQIMNFQKKRKSLEEEKEEKQDKNLIDILRDISSTISESKKFLINNEIVNEKMNIQFNEIKRKIQTPENA